MTTDYEAIPTEHAEAAGVLAKALGLFIAQRHTIQLSSVAAFLQVAAYPNDCIMDHAKKLGASQPTASKLLAELGPTTRYRRKALGLIVQRPLPTNRRRNELFLSSEGMALAHQVSEVLATFGEET